MISAFKKNKTKNESGRGIIDERSRRFSDVLSVDFYFRRVRGLADEEKPYSRVYNAQDRTAGEYYARALQEP